MGHLGADGKATLLPVARSFNLRSFRHWLKAALLPVTMTVRDGPLKGARWAATSGMRFVRGNFEPYKTDALLEALRCGDVVLDVGAHVGYYTVIAARAVGQEGRVAAFEPRPMTARFLRRNVELNSLSNVRVYEAAVGEQAGTAWFEGRTGTGTGHLAARGDIEVPVLVLDELVESGELPPPSLIKIDVEGGELDVLNGAMRTLNAHRPVLLLATHGETLHRDCLAMLERLQYKWRILDPGGESGDIEILAWPLPPSDKSHGT